MEERDAFFDAISQGDLQGVRDMLEASPALAAERDKGGVSALMTALYHGQMEIVECILAVRDGSLDIFEASALGNVPRLQDILSESPLAAHKTAQDGFSPLQLACFFGHPEAAGVLLEGGADPNVRSQNPMGVCAIHAALGGGRADIGHRLLAKGASPTLPSGEGWTPLHYAAYMGDVDLAQVLLRMGVDPIVRNKEGKTPADLAREKGNQEFLKFLEGETG